MLRAPNSVHFRASACAVALVLSCLAGTAGAQDLRAQEVATCLPGEITTWGDGRDRPAAGASVRLVYRHAGAPAWFDEAMVLGALQRAAQSWSGCGVPGEVIGETAALINPATVVLVQWDDAGARGNFGLANLARRTLSLGPGMFKLLAARNPRYPAHETLQMVISHEMGHFWGLMAHSKRCVDVMSYYDTPSGEVCSTRDGRSYMTLPEYRALLPTACDIARCRSINGR
jgi:hypothetical protein